MSRSRTPIVHVLSIAILLVGALGLVRSLDWRDAKFPGFFIMPNRVVPSVGLTDWSGVQDGRPLYQHVVLAVDEVPIADSSDGYRRAAAHAVGEPVRYLVARDQSHETRSFPLRRFTDWAYFSIFGLYFVGGLGYLVLAAFAGARWAEGPMFRGLAAYGWAGAAFAFTAMDMYGPGQLFRLHALAEACLPAAAAHMALVCPRDRLSGRPGILLLLYGAALALAVAHQVLLFDPRAYSMIHNFCQALVSVPVITFTVCLALALGQPPVELEPTPVRRLLLGAVVGIVMPALVLGISGVSGGLVPVNVTAWVTFLFPLAGIAAVAAVGSRTAARPA
jgi:hypothetical protein